MCYYLLKLIYIKLKPIKAFDFKMKEELTFIVNTISFFELIIGFVVFGIFIEEFELFEKTSIFMSIFVMFWMLIHLFLISYSAILNYQHYKLIYNIEINASKESLIDTFNLIFCFTVIFYFVLFAIDTKMYIKLIFYIIYMTVHVLYQIRYINDILK